MGKRGPKPGHGGRPIKYHDSEHKAIRSYSRKRRARLRQQGKWNDELRKRRKRKLRRRGRQKK